MKSPECIHGSFSFGGSFMDDLLLEFRIWLVEDGKSPRTVDSYSNDVKQYHSYHTGKAVDGQQHLTRFLFV